MVRSSLGPCALAFVFSLSLACGSASSPAQGAPDGAAATFDGALDDAASQRADGALSHGDSGISTDSGASPADGTATGKDAAGSDAAEGDATAPGCTTAADCGAGKLCVSRPDQACSPALNPRGCATTPWTCVEDPCGGVANGNDHECVCSSSLCSGYSGCAFTQDAGVVNCLVGG
jgi:hypothetical protein